MPKRPPSLHFSLRPRRASQVNPDEAGPPATENQTSSASPNSPLSPSTPGRSRVSLSRRQPPARVSTAAVAQQTRAEIRANTRIDWEFPAPPELQQYVRTQPDSAYVEREVELSSGSRSPSPPLYRPARTDTGAAVQQVSGHSLDHEPHQDEAYRFDNPDSVGDAVAARMKRWKQQMQQERKWNDGLRHWEKRRDAWTGAAKVRLDGSRRAIYHKDLVKDDTAVLRHHIRQPGPTSKRKSVSTSQSPHASNDESRRPASTRRSSASSSSSVSATSSSMDDSDYTTLVPVPPPLLAADHLIRSQIQPRNYRSIYTKIVAQGTAPNVPVNLRDIVSACVAGWKADGEWPPKSSLPEPSRAVAPSRRTAAMLATSSSQRQDGPIKTKMRNRLGSIVGHHEAPLLTPLSPVRDNGGERLFFQEGTEGKSLGMVERGVKRMSRVLKMVGGALMDPEDKLLIGDDGPEVPGLVPGSDEAVQKLKSHGLV